MKNKQFVVSLALIILCFGTTFTVAYLSLQSVIRDNTKQFTNLVAERIYDAINSELMKPIAVSRTMANDIYLMDRLKHESEFTQEQNVENISSYLDHIRSGFGYESSFLVADQSRCYYTHKGLNKVVDVENDAHDIWYKVFMEHGKDLDLYVDEDQTKHDTLTIFINKRIEDAEGNFMGVCGMGVQLDKLLHLVRENEERYHVEIDMVDGSGKVLVDFDSNNSRDEKIIQDATLDHQKSDDYVFKMQGDNFVGSRYVEYASWYLIIRNTEEYDDHAYRRLMVYFSLTLLFVLLVLFAALYFVMKRERILYNNSSIDVLTGLKSRRAYEEYIEGLGKKDRFDFTYVSLDLNGLKHTNDSIGHSAGDELLEGIGHLIAQYFGSKGQCFRIGGDEFAVIINHCNVDIEKTVREVKELVAQWHGNQVKSMSLSIGMARSSDHYIKDIQKLSELADVEMYKDKVNYYRETGYRRR